MKIDAQVTPVQRDRLQDIAARDQTTWQLAWRRELERAQRSQVQPAQPSKDTPQNDRPPQHSDDAPLAHSTARSIDDLPSPTPNVKPIEYGRDGSEHVLRSTVREYKAAAAPRVPETALEPSLQSVATSAYAFARHQLPAHGAQPSAAASLDALIARMERAAWLPKAAHVTVQGSRVSVALRDAGLSEQEVSHLLWRVRKEVGSLGFELAALVINGHVVQPAGE